MRSLVAVAVTPAWPAPVAAGPVRASIEVPGSKSMTARALVLAALAAPGSTSTLHRPLLARDTTLMAAGLRALGVRVDGPDDDASTWQVTPPAALRGPAHVDVGLAGTVMRFLPPVAALAHGPVTFDGDPRARARPLGQVIHALRTLGARIDDGDRGALPLTVHGRAGLAGGSVTIDASGSSQFVSALLLAAPRFTHGLDLRHAGPPLPSLPHVRMTVAMLRAAGAQVDDAEPDRWLVTPGPLAAQDLAIEPDLSNAAPFLAAAMVTGGSVTVTGWPPATTQPGDALRTLFTAMGGQVELTAAGLTVTGPAAHELHGLDADLREVSELTPVLAAVAALAGTPSILHGIGHIRGHETDRLAAIAAELTRLGGQVRETADGLEITPAPLHGALLRTYDDHRMAQLAAVLGLRVPGIEVDDVATTAKTMPDFVQRWTRMLPA